MEINQLLKIGVDIIKDRDYGNPLLEATMVLEDLLKVDRIYIYTRGKDRLGKDIRDRFLELMNLRASGYPIQYILGRQDFMGLDFYIEEGVLIPRSDTEILVEYVLKYIDENHGKEKIKVLDLGFGSGAIALSLAYYKKHIKVYGIDNSDLAMKVASINKDRFNLDNVQLYKGDLFEDLNMEGDFHIIISNPPYIPSEEIERLQTEVKAFEPRTALDGGRDGLDYYRQLVPGFKKYLRPQGLLIFEIGHDQGQAVKNLMLDGGLEDINILQDLQGLDRVVYGRK